MTRNPGTAASMIRLLTSILAGLAAAVFAVVLCVAIEFGVLSAWAAWEMSRNASGGLGAVSMPSVFPIAAIVGFAVGFYWQFRRRRAT
jgi:hypothetical protein